MDASPFDPYYEWLGIPPEEQPASYYRLLGIRDFESSTSVIANAADRQMAFLRTFQTGPHAQESQDLLNQISHARVILLNPDSREKYDCSLRKCQNSNASPSTSPSATGTAEAAEAAESPKVIELPGLVLPSKEPESPEVPTQPIQPPLDQTSSPSDTETSVTIQDDGTVPTDSVSSYASPAEAEPFTGTLSPEVTDKWQQSHQAFIKHTAPIRSMFRRFLSYFRYPTFVLRFCGGLFLLVGAHLLYMYASQSWLYTILGSVFLFTGIAYMLLYRLWLGHRYLRDVAWLLIALGLFFIGEFVYMAASANELSIFGWCGLIVKGAVALSIGIGTLWSLHCLPQKKNEEEP